MERIRATKTEVPRYRSAQKASLVCHFSIFCYGRRKHTWEPAQQKLSRIGEGAQFRKLQLAPALSSSAHFAANNLTDYANDSGK